MSISISRHLLSIMSFRHPPTFILLGIFPPKIMYADRIKKEQRRIIINRLSNFYQDIRPRIVWNLLQLPLEYFLMGVVFQKEVFQATQFHHEKQGELLKVCDYWPFVHFNHYLETRNSSILFCIFYSKTMEIHIAFLWTFNPL